ncbi:hypothetical protein EC973_006339 [Apophysomyces ossiformis]|uniref:Uncharacterized protein n=1 Tax=Apophysomyces ossiformis TaxID=679940 RepID=A0A8H7BVP9_9FUNG|nr:hypothetical protein EC973_006339 [Apophysomyces ossiformis]
MATATTDQSTPPPPATPSTALEDALSFLESIRQPDQLSPPSSPTMQSPNANDFYLWSPEQQDITTPPCSPAIELFPDLPPSS